MSDQTNQPQQNNQYRYQSYPNYYYPQSSPAYYPAYPYRQMPPQNQTQQAQNVQGMLPIERSYIENILRLNRGKQVTVYMTFEQNKEWNAMVFKGRIEAAGRDHIILSDTETGERYLLLMIYLNYITFDEKINYEYPFDSTGLLSSYNPR